MFTPNFDNPYLRPLLDAVIAGLTIWALLLVFSFFFGV